ncbi:hypothetical protein T484DRAFT_3112150 [Baffinella frigidus]|nr:hypothetical protein T484DRAFT_3112150 [Cryptophyta sp. CCMP2293]
MSSSSLLLAAAACLAVPAAAFLPASGLPLRSSPSRAAAVSMLALPPPPINPPALSSKPFPSVQASPSVRLAQAPEAKETKMSPEEEAQYRVLLERARNLKSLYRTALQAVPADEDVNAKPVPTPKVHNPTPSAL